MNREILEFGCSGMFSDELDKMGFRNQVVTGLCQNNNGRIFGYVRTVKIETIETDDENISTGLGFLETLEAGEILCVEGSQKFAYFGELMTRLSIRDKLGGVVIGGLTRDSIYTKNKPELTIFAQGYSPKDIKGRGRVQNIDVPVVISGISVKPKDLIFGDSDGVVIIPATAKEELLQRVHKCIDSERDIIRRINIGEKINQILNKHKEF